MDWRVFRELAGQGYAPRAMLDVGAHLGSFSKSIVEIFPGCAPVMIEPNPHCADALAQLPFESHAFAASHHSGEAELHLTTEWLQSTGASLYRENTHFFRDEVLQKIRVPRRRLDDVFAGRRFDIVKIDVQGAELDVLRGGKTIVAQADYLLMEVSLVDYNAGGARAEDVFAELTAMGFSCAGVLEFHRLKGVANGALLQMDFLFENRARWGRIALDQTGIERLVDQSLARGEIASALETLLKLRHAAPQSPAIVPLLQKAMAPAVEQINRYMNAKDWAQAATVASPLAKILPAFVPAQHAAMVIGASLSDPSGASEFARNLLAVNPHDVYAARVLSRSQIVAQAKPGEAEPARMALFPPSGRHPLVTLRDLHDAATAILCGDLDPADLPRLDVYMAEAQSLHIDVPDDSDLPGWVKHYRLAMDAMRPSRLFDAIPQSNPVAPPAFAAGSGEILSHGEFVRRIANVNPSAVFFVAADEKYIELYANHYIESVASKCDVPYAIVLHVIGGAGRLAQVSGALDRKGSRIFLTGDDFDAGSVTVRCYDTPPKGLIAHPAAHFQSARFRWLGWLLRAVNRPVFVSDIDLLLQRGVSDLLAREMSNDIVLNENRGNMNCGSRLTANLLLLNPTPNAHVYAAALKAYLDDTLSQPEVSRWIDQFGLLMARHRLRRERPAAKIGYFDTSSDINNVMYRSYEKNPFRFLSLYHGFDMASLKSAA